MSLPSIKTGLMEKGLLHKKGVVGVPIKGLVYEVKRKKDLLSDEEDEPEMHPDSTFLRLH
jgi:hypothetical protein